MSATEVYKDALTSIAGNGCCDGYQEAALVAEKALRLVNQTQYDGSLDSLLEGQIPTNIYNYIKRVMTAHIEEHHAPDNTEYKSMQIPVMDKPPKHRNCMQCLAHREYFKRICGLDDRSMRFMRQAAESLTVDTAIKEDSDLGIKRCCKECSKWKSFHASTPFGRNSGSPNAGDCSQLGTMTGSAFYCKYFEEAS